MKNYRGTKFFFLLFLLLTPFVALPSFAQSKAGTTVGQFLKIEPSARVAALGNAGVSLAGEVSAAYYNPAALGRMFHTSIQFTHSEWLAGIDYNYAAAAIRAGSYGTLMLQITALNSGDISVRTVEQPEGTGERYDVTNFALGLGYGRQLTQSISVGFQIGYMRETIWHSSLSNTALNFGVQYEIISDGATLGASVSNFGPRASYNGRDFYVDYDLSPTKHGDNDQIPAELRTESFALPTLFRVGLSVPFHFMESNQLLISVDAMHPNDNTESVNAGAELKLWNMLALRGGYRNLFLEDLEGGLVLGAGLDIDLSGYRILFDYGWADYGILKQTQRFTVGLGF